MASGATRNTAARVANFQKAEVSDVPSLCVVCLGPSKALRMLQQPKGKQCRKCNRPFTVFTWRAAEDARPRSTQFCQGCCTAVNACQSCFCDLATGLTMEQRAAATPEELAETVRVKQGRIDATGDDSCLTSNAGKRRRFEQKICSFFQKGFCSRGEKCPYRHETAAAGASPAVQGDDAEPAQGNAGDDHELSVDSGRVVGKKAAALP